MISITPAIGIDFGTSNSKMAWYNPGIMQAEVLENDEGDKLTPSVVYFGENEILVGTPAINMLEDEQAWERVIMGIKRSLVSDPVINLPDREVTSMGVVAEILRKLKRDAEELHFRPDTMGAFSLKQEVKHAVITCPASFDIAEQDKIKDAARLAGFSEVELLPEPVAAALAYTRMRQQTGFEVGNHVLIYDLGGGTFDLAVLVRENNGPFRLGLDPQGIKQCGGDDFDDALYHYWDLFAQKQLDRPISLTGERDLHFLYMCRKRKENLTNMRRCTFSSLLAPDSKPFKFDMDQVTFENLIRDKVGQTVQETRAILARAKEAGCEVDTFVLVGGSSQVPMVKRLLEENLRLKVAEWRYREVAVALGAAYHAYNIWGPEKEEHDQTIQAIRRMTKEVWTPSQVSQDERAENKQYRGAVEAAWADRKVDQTEVERLARLATRIGLSKEQAAAIERQVMGDTREAVLAGQSKVVVRPPVKRENFTLTNTLNGHIGMVWCVAINPDGQTLASSSEDRTVRLWDLCTGQQLRVLSGHAGGVYTIAFSFVGQTLLSGSADQTIKVWNLQTGMPLHTFTEQFGSLLNVTSLAVSPNGQLLASGSRDQGIRFWNLHSGAVLRPLVGHTGIIWSVAFSPDGQFLASGSADRSVRLWNLRTGGLIRSFNEHLDSVQSVAFSPNGQLLASGSVDRTIRFWNLRTGVSLRPLIGHTGAVTSIAFSPDGLFLASGSLDQTIRLWSLRSGALIHTFTGHLGGVHFVALDRQFLASGSADTTVKVWRWA